MFAIITNYRTLYLGFIKNTFSSEISDWGNENKWWFKESNGTTIDDLAHKIFEDRKVDWTDKSYMDELILKYKTEKTKILDQDGEKTQILNETVTSVETVMKSVTKEILEKGYTINNKEDLHVLQSLLDNFSDNKIQIPKEFDKYVNDWYSMVLSNWEFKIYDNDMNSELIATIDKDWKLEEASF